MYVEWIKSRPTVNFDLGVYEMAIAHETKHDTFDLSWALFHWRSLFLVQSDHWIWNLVSLKSSFASMKTAPIWTLRAVAEIPRAAASACFFSFWRVTVLEALQWSFDFSCFVRAECRKFLVPVANPFIRNLFELEGKFVSRHRAQCMTALWVSNPSQLNLSSHPRWNFKLFFFSLHLVQHRLAAICQFSLSI